jgi:hypothetical protein
MLECSSSTTAATISLARDGSRVPQRRAPASIIAADAALHVLRAAREQAAVAFDRRERIAHAGHTDGVGVTQNISDGPARGPRARDHIRAPLARVFDDTSRPIAASPRQSASAISRRLALPVTSSG